MSYEYYEFDKSEYMGRLDSLRSIMKKRDLGAVILTEEENIRWLSGYWVFTMQDGVMSTAVITPLSEKEEPCLLLTSEGTGEDLSWIKDIRYWDEGLDSYLKIDKGKVMFEIMKQKAIRSKRIGMELSSGMRINLDQDDIDSFRNRLIGTEIIDISDDILKLRSLKSEAEVRKLKKACQITCRSIIKSFSEVREGITERSLGQKLGKYFFEYGATGIGHIGVSFGELAIKFAHSDPKEYPLERGVLVKVDAGCSFEGYRCDMYRMACLGSPDAGEHRVANTIAEANREVIKNIKDGVTCRTLYQTALGVFNSNGLSHLLSPFHYIGHGIGLGIHEPPYIFKDSKDVLSAGMVLTIEPWTYDSERLGYSMNIEDVVLVTKNGSEILTPIDRGIYNI